MHFTLYVRVNEVHVRSPLSNDESILFHASLLASIAPSSFRSPREVRACGAVTARANGGK
jgi:hypothetical protein